MDDPLYALLRRREQEHLKAALLARDRENGRQHFEMANRCRDGLALLAKQQKTAFIQ